KTLTQGQASSKASGFVRGTGSSTIPQIRRILEGKEAMNYWLFKSEPFKFSFDHLKKLGKAGSEWDGVRNYAARNNMRAMEVGDLGFFYHSNEGLDVVGIVEVSAAAHPDSTTDDPRWECVDVRAVCDVPNPPTLAEI